MLFESMKSFLQGYFWTSNIIVFGETYLYTIFFSISLIIFYLCICIKKYVIQIVAKKL
jgi:hypothetical protein